MATDLLAQLVDTVAEPINAHLSANGVPDPAPLAAPTVPGPDLALPCHKYARVFRRAPQAIAEELGAAAETHPLVLRAEATRGFLNLFFDWGAVAEQVVGWALTDDGALGRSQAMAGQRVLIEYSAPNTNKPQHLGHCRNNLLGHTVATLIEAAGAEVRRINLINDRGIHICKSMVAYARFGDGATPASTGVKGDHFVGSYYVKFDQAFNAEYAAATAGMADDDKPDKDAYFNGDSDLGGAARGMLQRWEAGDAEVVGLWETMNGWCKSGFDETYARMGVHFDQVDLESNTYLLGKALVERGLEDGNFYVLDNGAKAFDLTRIGMKGKKVVLRANGTSLYITQDLGTATQRFADHQPDHLIYVVGDEQNHYFKVLFGILGDLDPGTKGRLSHRSYGMVELPDGKMKSREGTVVDADDLMTELRDMVAAGSVERWAGLDPAEQARRAEAIGLGGLKFFLLRFNPATSFVFDKEKSIAIEGETGPYCQYAHARSTSLLAKIGDQAAGVDPDWSVLTHPKARAVLTALLAFPKAVRMGAEKLDPSWVAQATYDVAKSLASFYNDPDSRILGSEPPVLAARAAMIRATQRVLAAGLGLMGIVALDEM